MKITLISTATFPSDQGIRTISSVLKKAGYEVKIIFLAYSEDYSRVYPEKALNQVIKICKDSDLVGINSFASTAPRAIHVINKLKRLNNPIVWGGIHATISPEECIKYCDIVCVGEGESAVVDLAKAIENKKPIGKIENLWIKKGDKIIK